jgi:hypothetical protein
MDSNHRSPVKDQLVETVLFDFQRRLGSAPSEVGDLNRAIWAAISAGTITSAKTTTASAGDGGRLEPSCRERVCRLSTSRVVIVMFCDHRRSRCRSAWTPCDVGDGAARRDDILAQHKGRRHAHRFDRGIDAAPRGHFRDCLGRLAGAGIDLSCGVLTRRDRSGLLLNRNPSGAWNA